MRRGHASFAAGSYLRQRAGRNCSFLAPQFARFLGQIARDAAANFAGNLYMPVHAVPQPHDCPRQNRFSRAAPFTRDGTRTRTAKGQRILSPLRLPFRHPSPLKIVEIRSFQSFYPSVNVFSVYESFSSLKRSMAFYGCLIKKL